MKRQLVRTGRVWQQSFRDYTVGHAEALWTKVAYIQYNPVRKGLVDKPDEYHYSSANPLWENDLDEV